MEACLASQFADLSSYQRRGAARSLGRSGCMAVAGSRTQKWHRKGSNIERPHWAGGSLVVEGFLNMHLGSIPAKPRQGVHSQRSRRQRGSTTYSPVEEEGLRAQGLPRVPLPGSTPWNFAAVQNFVRHRKLFTFVSANTLMLREILGLV